MERELHSVEIEVRFSDLDAFGHVNNAVFLTYVEQARIRYFDDIFPESIYSQKKSVILARVELDFLEPIYAYDKLVVYTWCSKIGNKSFNLEHKIERTSNSKSGLAAKCKSIIVAYDYEKQESITLPVSWTQWLKLNNSF
jgi:acyl-CoA thioester hydrolase